MASAKQLQDGERWYVTVNKEITDPSPDEPFPCGEWVSRTVPRLELQGCFALFWFPKPF